MALPPVNARYQSVTAELSELAGEWRKTDAYPPMAGGLSGGEHRALLLAVRKEHELRTPTLDFLLLDGFLQRWVLEQWGQDSLIGMSIAA